MESCQGKQVLQGAKEEQGSSRFRATSESPDGLDQQIGTALIFEAIFGSLPLNPPNSVHYRGRALFQDDLDYLTSLFLS